MRRRKKNKKEKLWLLVLVMLLIVIVTKLQDNSSAVLAGKTQEVANGGEDYNVTSIELKESMIYEGDLILINKDNKYQFNKADTSKLVNIYDNKNRCYVVSKTSILLDKKVNEAFIKMTNDAKSQNVNNFLVVSGYRTLEEQNNILQKEITNNKKIMDKAKAEQEAKKSIAIPGASEHHTGLAIDIDINGSKGINSFENTKQYKWIEKNCNLYGFVIRYRSDKSSITGIIDEPWHIRYVGIPHAKVMTDKNMCLEEYIEYLKNEKKVDINENGKLKYTIQYIGKEDLNKKLDIPSNAEYTISGDYKDGVIITIKY